MCESLVCKKMWPSTRVVDTGKFQPANREGGVAFRKKKMRKEKNGLSEKEKLEREGACWPWH